MLFSIFRPWGLMGWLFLNMPWNLEFDLVLVTVQFVNLNQ